MNAPTGATSSTRRLLVIAILAAAIAGLLLSSYLYADRDPTPHGIRIDVVGRPAVAATVQTELQQALPGGFRVATTATAAAARRDLLDQAAQGALAFGPHRSAVIMVADAASLTQAQAISTVLQQLTTATGVQAREVDVVPLPVDDRAGIAAYLVSIALLIPSVIGGVGIYLIGRRRRIWVRAAATTTFAILTGGIAVLVADPLLATLTGAPAQLFGFCSLGALAFALVVSAIQATAGLPGTGLAALILLFLGNAAAGGSVPTTLLPNVYRQISPWLPNAAVVHGIRSATYFGDHGIAQPLLVLCLWIAAAIVTLLANDLIHLHAIQRADVNRSEVFARSGIAHTRDWARTRHTTGAHELAPGRQEWTTN